MPLDETAVTTTDDEFYGLHPELTSNGQRTPLSPGMLNYDHLQAEWRLLYRKHLGGNGAGGEIQPAPVEPYVKTPGGYNVNPVIFSTKAHGYVVRGPWCSTHGDGAAAAAD